MMDKELLRSRSEWAEYVVNSKRLLLKKSNNLPQKKENLQYFVATGNHLLNWVVGYSEDATVGKVRSLI